MPKRRALFVAVGLVAAWFVVGGITGPASGKLADVQKNDNASFLPGSAEATKVQNLITRFSTYDLGRLVWWPSRLSRTDAPVESTLVRA
jgi:hypothetical protein